MIVTKHISLDNDCIEKIEPYTKVHNGNFSAAIRDIIDRAGKSGYPGNSKAIDSSLFKWILDGNEGILIPEYVIDEMIDPGLIKSTGKLEEYVNHRFKDLEWDVKLVLECDNPSYPSEVFMEIHGAPREIKFTACLMSQFFVKNSLDYSPLELQSVINCNNHIKIGLAHSDKQKAIASLVKFFGEMDETNNAIKSRPEFWKEIVNRHHLSNYNMVTVHRNYFEDVLAGKVPQGEITIENLAKKPIPDIPLPEMLFLIKKVYETSRVADRIDIDKDAIVLYHNYRNKESVETIKKSLFSLLESNGHLYDAKSTANMIVFTHRPDIGAKINEIVDNLKTNTNRIDYEMVMFMSFLKELKELPDIPMSLTSLGSRIGRSLMQEYETDNQNTVWNPETFKKAMELIDSKLKRESEWKLNGKSMQYRIKTCNIANEGNSFNTYICHTAREAFKGALNYAFGNKAELKIEKMLSHGDKCCEVTIQLH
jgi:predicted hydrocarbon binding protein